MLCPVTAGSLGLSIAALLYDLLLEAFLLRLRNKAINRALLGIDLPGGARAMVSADAGGVSILMSCRSEIEALEQYKNVTKAKINRNKFSGLRLGSWKGVVLPGPFRSCDGSILECGSGRIFSCRRYCRRYSQS